MTRCTRTPGRLTPAKPGGVLPTGSGPIGWTGVIPPGVTSPADDEFQDAVNHQAELLWGEVQRLEAQQNPGGVAPVFTPAIVRMARHTSVAIFANNRRTRRDLFLEMGLAGAGAVMGVAGNKTDEPWGWAVLVGALMSVLLLLVIKSARGTS